MRRVGRWGLLAALGTACLALWLPRTPLPADAVNWALARAFRDPGGLRVHLGGLGTDGFGVLVVRRLSVTASEGGVQEPLCAVDSVTLRADPWALLRGPSSWDRVPRSLIVRGLSLKVLRGADGVWNLSAALPRGGSAGGTGRTFWPMPALRVELRGGLLSFTDVPRGFGTVVRGLQGFADGAGGTIHFALSGSTPGRRNRNLAVSGSWNPAGGFAARLNLRRVAMAGILDYLLPPKGPRFTRGRASLEFRLSKALGRPPRERGWASLSGGSVLLPGFRAPLKGLDGRVYFDGGDLRFTGVRASFLGSEWTAGGTILGLEDPVAKLSLSNPAVPLGVLTRQVAALDPLRLSGTAAASAVLSGRLARPRVRARVTADRFWVGGIAMRRLDASAHFVPDRLVIDRVSAAFWGGQVQGSGSLDFLGRGSVAAGLTVTGALLRLGSVSGRPLPLDGMARAACFLDGPLRDPRLAFSAGVSRLRLGALDFGTVSLAGGYTNGGLFAAADSRDGALKARLAAAAGPAGMRIRTGVVSIHGLPLGASLLTLGQLGPWVSVGPGVAHALAALAGRMDGRWSVEADASGALTDPALSLRTTCAGGRLQTGLGRSSEILPLAWNLGATLAGGFLTVGDAKGPAVLTLGSGFKGSALLNARGSLSLSRPSPAGIRAALSADLALLKPFGFAKDEKGTLTAGLTVTGSVAVPRLFGTLAVRGFSCLPVGYLGPVRDGKLEVRIGPRSLDLVGLSFRSPGRVTAAGTLELGPGYHPRGGTLKVWAAGKGLALVRWPELGSATLRFVPLMVWVRGPDTPVEVGGRVVVGQARIIYGSTGASGTGPKAPARTSEPAGRPRPVELDLRVALGNGVWYDRHQSHTLDFTDPAQLLRETLESAQGSLLSPDLSLHFAPTTTDIRVRGTTPDIDLSGGLTVDRGWVTIMQSDFQLGGQEGPTTIVLKGTHAEVSGTAAVNLTYTRFDPVTGHPTPHEVQALAMLSPRRSRSSGGQFVDFRLKFDSNPPIIPGDPERQQTAVLNLVLLGDPVIDLTNNDDLLMSPATAVASGQQADPGTLLANASLGAVTTAFARRELSGLMSRFDIPVTSWFDVLRINPRIRYLMGAASPLAGTTGASPLAAAPSAGGYDIDWSLELGKSFTKSLYGTFQAVTFGQADRDSVIVASQSNQAVQSYGLRGGFEYNLGAYREIDVYGDFGCDDNLNPLAYPSNWSAPNPSYLVQWRATIPTGSYGAADDRRRRFDGGAGL